MEIHLQIIGVLLMLLALIHIGFPRYFNWSNELKSLSLINRQMMTTHTFFIALTVFLMGLLSFVRSSDLIGTPLGKIISLGFGFFWLIRLGFQLFGYSAELWKGKLFETIIHVLFTFFWLYMSFIYLKIYFIE
jgi:hypothetical protein